MARSNNRRPEPSGVTEEVILLWVVLGLIVVGAGALSLAMHLGHALAGTGVNVPGNPAAIALGLADGELVWPGAAGWSVLIALAVLVVAIAVGAGLLVRRARRSRTRVDHLAASLGRGRDLEPISRKSVEATAKRLGVTAAAGSSGVAGNGKALGVAPGVPIGVTVADRAPLYGSWEDLHVEIWGPRMGKALAASTPVLTPHGWVPIKDLARGCRVIGADGKATTVTGVYPQGIRPALRVHLSDGTSVLCDPDHLWTVRPKIRADKKHALMWRTWTTQQLLDRALRRASGGARFYLPIVAPVQLDGALPPGRPVEPGPPDGRGVNIRPAEAPRPLPVDPYLLGVLLGDGGLSGGSVRLSTADAEDLLSVLVLPPGITARPVSGSNYDWTLSAGRSGPRNPLVAALRQLDLMGHTSLTKHIPQAYLLADVETRRALLAGLMDTDGSIDINGAIEFSTSSPQLSEDFRFLVQALGGTVTTTRRETSGVPSYRSNIRLPADAPPPFRLARKCDRWTELAPLRRRALPVRAITAIEPEGTTDMVCISVAAPDGLFVTEHCIVTHNTTSKAVPAILEAPGGVVVTSNKRDIVDATRGIRAAGDRPLFVFDLQDIAISPTGCDRTANGMPPWWYDPLSYVTDEVRADKLADCFADAEAGDHLKTDAHFDPLGKALLSAVLLAAALDARPITAAYTWLTRIGDETPGEILRAGGYDMRAEQFFGIANTEKRERSSIYSTARRMAACLTYRHIISWVTDDPATNPDGRPRPHFDPGEFVRSGGTLYSLSEEGKGNAGALTMALTKAVVEAAVEAAKASGGRLSTPLLVVLDEAANVCRWRELPSLYSHFGSRGIITMTILQSWSQGVGVWGPEGMKKLWSAANIKTYGGGVAEKEFLEMLSQLIGDHDRVVTSVSKGGGRGTQATVSRQLRRERILDVADLAALPKGRAIVLASGARPTLICTQPWLTGPRAEQVRASITRHDPAGQETIAIMTAELAAANEHASTATDYQVLATAAADR